MPAPISVIVPTLNAAPDLPNCLESLFEGLSAGLVHELIIADGGSTDDTLTIARDVGAVIVETPASRGGQLRRGVEMANGTWLLIIHSDTQLQPGWTQAVSRHLRSHENLAGYCRLAFRARGVWPVWVARWANLRSRLLDLPYGDQSLLITRCLYDRVGGFPELQLMEDVALARALRGRLVELPTTALTSAARYERHGWLRQGSRNLVTLARYFAGVGSDRLNAAYSPRS